MQDSQQKIMMQVAQALQQGADPKELLSELVKMGMQQDQAVSVIQTVMSQLQGGGAQQQAAGPQMARGGYTGTWSGNQGFANGGISPYNYNDPYSTMMAMGGYVPQLRRAQVGGQKSDDLGVPQEQDYQDHGSYMRAMNDYFNNLYIPEDISADDMSYDGSSPVSVTDTPMTGPQVGGYQNPALAAISTPTIASSQAITPSRTASTAQVYGTPHPEYSIVDLLHSLGAKSDYKTRSQIAKELGIDSYKGHDYQNAEMIKRLSIYAKEIQKNPDDYDIAKLIATNPTSQTDSIPTSVIPITKDSTGKVIVDSTGNPNAPYLGDNKNSSKASSGFWSPNMTFAAGVIGSGAAIHYGSKKLKTYYKKMDDLKRVFNKNLPSIEKSNIAKGTEGLGSETKMIYQAFKKMPKADQKRLIQDENLKKILSDARHEETIANASEVQKALKIAEEEAAIPTSPAGKAAIEAARLARLARIAERTRQGVSAVKGFLGKFGEAMKEGKFAMGGAYIPEYGQMAYGGYHSEIPGVFNQPVDRMNKAMYGMGMAQGGQMPQWLAERRFSAAGNRDQMNDYGYADGGVVEIDPADYEQTIQRLRDGGYEFEILH